VGGQPDTSRPLEAAARPPLDGLVRISIDLYQHVPSKDSQRRLLDRMAAGVLTTLEAMNTDPGVALVSYVAYLHGIAGRIKRQQNRRAAPELGRTPPLSPHP
jgi:hypothetical protein